MSETPRPRPSRGVMGYVAELQQFDPVPPYVYELDPPRAPRGRPVPPHPAQLPPTVPTATIVSPMRQRPRRRSGSAIIAGAAVVILVGAGLTYAGLGGPDGEPLAQEPSAAAPSVPVDGPLPLAPPRPGAEPVAGRTTGAAVRTTGTAGPLPETVDLPPYPALPQSLVPVPVTTAAPSATTGPAPTEPAAAPAAPMPLTATLRHVADPAEGGFLGYAGTIRLENPGDRDVSGWRVTLTVPGGNLVTASGASVAQDGESVTFTPDREAVVPAGGAVTFTFSVEGLLAALPGGCLVDADPCR